MQLATRLLINKLAGEPGFEPGLHGPEPCVLPLDDSPVTRHDELPARASNVTELKSRRFSELVNDILPSIVALATPQKAAEIGQLIQSPPSYH